MSYTTADLLEIIKNKAFIPSTQDTFDDDELLALATDEMRDNIVPQIKRVREEYYLVHSDHDFSSSNKTIRIPSRAVGGSLREISLVNGNNEYNLAKKTVEDRVTSGGGVSEGFYIEGNKIHILEGGSGTIRLYYYVRPGKLIVTTNATQATGPAVAGVIPTGAIPAYMGALGSVVTIDIIEECSGFDLLARTVSATIGTNEITIAASDVPDEMGVGTWITLSDTSPVPQIPVEFFPYLGQAVAVQVLDSIGDFEAKASAEAKLEKIERNATSMISPRVEGEGRKFVPQRNKGSIFNRWR